MIRLLSMTALSLALGSTVGVGPGSAPRPTIVMWLSSRSFPGWHHVAAATVASGCTSSVHGLGARS